MFAVFACVKDKNRKLDVPCLDPLSWGMGDEPDQKLLCRRGRVQLFDTEQEAETAIGTTLVRAKMYGHKWTDLFDFVILQCQEPAKADTTPPTT